MPDQAGNVVTALKKVGGFSKAVRVRADDGRMYIVKGLQAGEDMGPRLFVDQVVGRLGTAIGAPVGEVGVLSINEQIIDGSLSAAHLTPGPMHACLEVPRVNVGWGVEHLDVAANPHRFALLATLYGWCGADDHQFFYSLDPPELVYSFDHGHFFPGEPLWSPEALNEAPPAEFDRVIIEAAFLSSTALRQSLHPLASITPDTIAKAVGASPVEWGVDLNARIATATFLEKRRHQLLKQFS
ncbi:MAG: hypothetical protein H0T91_06480 [Propionibacteriaceae bacterium]|nr:hypothetical protein [Propionibacteriaceae bacterium]